MAARGLMIRMFGSSERTSYVPPGMAGQEITGIEGRKADDLW